MKQFLTVFRFTYMDAVRKKAFKISTLIIFVLILGVCLAAKFLGSDDGAQDSQTSAESAGTVFYLDASGAIPGGENALTAEGYAVFAIAADGEAEAREKVKQDSGAALVVVSPSEGQPNINVLMKDFLSGLNADGIARALTREWQASRLAELGASEEAIAVSQARPLYDAEAVGEVQEAGYALGIVFSMLMFFAVYFYGLSVANSIATEKTSRVMETLVVSAKPKNILAGKCAAMGAVGLTQMAAMIAFAVLCYNALVPAGTQILGMSLSFSGLTLGTGLAMLAYFLLGYALYAMMNAVCGASVSRIEDTSSALMPVSMIAMISFYIGYFTSLFNATGAVMTKVAMYVPFCSPFGMPFRILNGSASPAQIAISLGILLATIALVSMFSVRLYTAGVMYYGKRLKIKDMFKMKP